MTDELPHLYDDLADWFHVLSDPADYEEEAEVYINTFVIATGRLPRTLLELGAGGGNLASHYKQHIASVTLTDLSPGMLDLSRTLNPECEHIAGDMRTLRLDRQFDAVLIHDAIVYMLTEEELREALATAYAHLRPGGVAMFLPDHTRETYADHTEHGGHDGDGRALRYLEWSFDPDPADTTYLVDYVYVLHEDGKPSRVVHDQHTEGLFSRDTWLRLLTEVGFRVETYPRALTDPPYELCEIFVGHRPAGEDITDAKDKAQFSVGGFTYREAPADHPIYRSGWLIGPVGRPPGPPDRD